MVEKAFYLGGKSRRCLLIACPNCGRERWICKENISKQSNRCKSCAMKEIWLKRKGPPQPRPPEFHRRRKHTGRIVDGNGYIKIKMRNHPMADGNGYIFEHRLVMAKHLNRTLEPWEAVHHLNGKKSDNRIENLELLPKDKHRAMSPLHHRIQYLENLLRQNSIPF